jgi:hypothetical protein
MNKAVIFGIISGGFKSLFFTVGHSLFSVVVGTVLNVISSVDAS